MLLAYDNIIYSLQRAGGISLYWTELLKRLVAEDTIKLKIVDDSKKNIFRQQINLNNVKKIDSYKLIPAYLKRYFNINKTGKNTIFHSSYYRIAKESINVTTVHDLIYEKFRMDYPSRIHILQKRHAIQESNRIICVSENTKNDLLDIYKNIDPDIVHVVHNGVDPIYKVLPVDFNHDLEKKLVFGRYSYIIYVGDRRSDHKNFSITIKLCRYLNKPLVMVGGGILSDKERAILDTNLSKSYQHFHNVSSNELNILYNYAFCLLYPSYYEGFGIPLLEAQKAGCPVVACHVSSIPEVVGNGALLSKNVDQAQLIDLVYSLSNNEIRKNLIQLGLENSKKYSWDITYKKTKEIYRDLGLGI